VSKSCPLNFKRVDENISRISSLIVSLLVLLYLYSLNVYILVFLVVDFSLKLFWKKEFSLLYLMAKEAKKIFSFKDEFVDGGAKRLAAYFGLLFVLLLFIVHFLDLWFLTLLVAIIFLSCSLMDLFFKFCVGCKVYFIIKKIYPRFNL